MKTIQKTGNNWVYKGESITEPPPGQFGFVYCITCNVTGRKYIGKKQFWSRRSKKVVGKRNRKYTIKASDWLAYWSSCDELKADVKSLGEDCFTREILQMYETKGQQTYGEVEHQIKADVLTAKLPDGSRAYYNANILARWYTKR